MSKNDFYNAIRQAYNNASSVRLYASKLFPERRPELRAAIDKFLALLPPGGKILDVGCGTGKDVGSFRQKGFDARGIDVSDEMIKLARSVYGDYFAVGDILELQKIQETFDGIASIAALQHVHPDDMPGVFVNLNKLLKPFSYLFFFTKEGDGLYQDTRLGENFMRPSYLYNRPFLSNALNAAGFSVIDEQSAYFDRAGRDEQWIMFTAQKTQQKIQDSA